MKSVAFSVGFGLFLLMLAVICIVDSVPLADNESNKLVVVSSSSSDSDSVENRPKRDAKNGQHSFSDYPFRGVRYRLPSTKKSYGPIDDSSSSSIEDVDDDVMLEARSRRGTYSRKSSFSTRPLYGRNGAAVVARSARSFAKRSSPAGKLLHNNVGDNDDEAEDVEQFISMLSEQLHRQDNSNDADEEEDEDNDVAAEDNSEESESDLDKLADSVALAILLDELAAEEEKMSADKLSHSISQMKKKKSLSSSSLKRGDKKKKKRNNKKRSMASFMDRLIAEAPVELTENDIDKELLIDLAAMLAEEGLEQDEIEAILTQLVATAFSEGKDINEDDMKKNKKKRSGEWRKLPRGAVRWRSGLHSQDNDANDWHQSSLSSIHHRDGPEDESSSSESAKFIGRGFHRRLGNGETFSAPTEEKNLKRLPLHLHSMKTKNAVTHFNHRNSLLSESDSSNEANQQLSEEPMEMQHATQAMKRMKRSSSSSSKEADAVKQASVNGTALPPSSVINASSAVVSFKDQNEANKRQQQQQEKHSTVIRKKSVDWDDYFGFDKKKKKRGGSSIQYDGDDDEIEQQEESTRNFLDSQYYKSIAGALAYRRKRGGAHEHDNGMMRKRKVATTINNQTHHHQQQQQHANSKFDVSGSSSDVDDAEDAMNAALRAMQQSAQQHSQSYDIDRMRTELLTELVDKLEADDIDEMTRRLALQFIQAIDDEEESGDDNDKDNDDIQDSENNIDGAKHKQRYLKRSVNSAIAAHKKSRNAARLPSFEGKFIDSLIISQQINR